MDKIDYLSWPRREIFEFFSPMSDPFYSLTFNLDVTRLYDFVRPRGLSFYYSLVWLCTKAVNSVSAFGYALDGGEVVSLGDRMPSFTDIKKGSELFYIVTLQMEDSLERFCAAAAKKSREQTGFIDPAGGEKAVIFFSCVPWVELTSFENERDMDRDDAIPRISWGKYREENGRKTLGLSVELNHRFVDGVHVGMFAKELERLMSAL